MRHGSVVMLCAVALLVFGVVMVTSAGMSIGPNEAVATESTGLENAGSETVDQTPAPVTNPDSFIGILTSRNAQYFVVAVVGMFVVSRLPIRRWVDWLETCCPATGRFGYVGLGVGTLVLLAIVATVYVPGLGQERNGSHRWIAPGIPGVGTIQPSEIAKWLCPLLIAWFVAAGLRTGADGTRPRSTRLLPGVLPAVLAAGLVSGLIVIEDLGTGALVAAAAGVMLLAGGMRLWHAGLFLPPALLGVALAVIDSPYRAQRLLTFLDPFANPQGDGYHMVQSLATVAGGGIFGRGLGHGVQKFGYLPQDTTDFLFAVVCEELGLAGAVAILSLLGLMVCMLVGIARREPSALAKLFILGVGATIAIQATINLAVVLGLAPTKGIALPLVSAGGTGWILTALSLGVAASLDRTAPEEAIDASTEHEPAGDDLDLDHAVPA